MNRFTESKSRSEKNAEIEKDKGESKIFADPSTPNPDCTCHIGDCACQGGGK